MGKMNKVKVGSRKKRVQVVAVTAPKRTRKTKGSKRSSSSSGLMGQIGMGIGSYFGGPAGGLAGMAAGKLISKLTGFGDYKVSQNSISMGNSVPTFSNGGKGMRVCHREYLTDITGSIGFVNQVYAINPGLVLSFPWLSLIAADFEEYSMEGLVYEYRPASGTAVSATSSALGVVIMATDYDVLNATFSTKQQMESYEYSTSTVPFTGCIHPVECAKKLNVFSSQFTRSGPVPATGDARLYDVGNFQIATQGMQSAYLVGELWVSYDVVFRKPRLPQTIQLPAYSRARENPLGSSTSANPFGTSGGLILSDSTLTATFSGKILTIPQPGIYCLRVDLYATAQTPTLTTSLSSGIILGPLVLNGNTSNNVGISTANTFTLIQILNVQTPGSVSKVTFNGASMTAGSADMYLTLMQRTLPLSLSQMFGDSLRINDFGASRSLSEEFEEMKLPPSVDSSGRL